MKTPYPTREELSAQFDFTDGQFYWRIDQKINPGKPVGISVTRKGYARINFRLRPLFLHRAIWKFVHGYDPIQVDHINGNRLDNRVENLRDVTQSQNQWNMRPRGGKSKFKGVYLAKGGKKWGARIKLNGVTRHLGTFAGEVDAALAYDRASVELHGQNGLTNRSMALLSE